MLPLIFGSSRNIAWKNDQFYSLRWKMICIHVLILRSRSKSCWNVGIQDLALLVLFETNSLNARDKSYWPTNWSCLIAVPGDLADARCLPLWRLLPYCESWHALILSIRPPELLRTCSWVPFVTGTNFIQFPLLFNLPVALLWLFRERASVSAQKKPIYPIHHKYFKLGTQRW